MSEREREVLALLAYGLDIAGAAEQLAIAPTTIKSHIGRASYKLSARSRVETVAIAIRDGHLAER